jgi:hypothetical protein
LRGTVLGPPLHTHAPGQLQYLAETGDAQGAGQLGVAELVVMLLEKLLLGRGVADVGHRKKRGQPIAAAQFLKSLFLCYQLLAGKACGGGE